LWRIADVSVATLHALAEADAYASMGLNRQRALWAVKALHGKPLPLFDTPTLYDTPVGHAEPCDRPAPLPPVSPPGEVIRDYRTTGLSLKAHPISFIRDNLTRRRILTAAEIRDDKLCPHGRRAAAGGLVLFRQRPGTAKGIMFMTLEDETGRIDLIVRPRVYQQYPAALYERVVTAHGRVERADGVLHLLVNRIEALTEDATDIPRLSRDFR